MDPEERGFNVSEFLIQLVVAGGLEWGAFEIGFRCKVDRRYRCMSSESELDIPGLHPVQFAIVF